MTEWNRLLPPVRLSFQKIQFEKKRELSCRGQIEYLPHAFIPIHLYFP